MLFITNRTPRESSMSEENRSISFDYQNTAVSQYLFFCERISNGEYIERKSQYFFSWLKNRLDPETQILFYIHGFNNNMEPDIFRNTMILQELFDDVQEKLVYVVPLIWPCDDDSVLAFADDYWDDQDAADASASAYARLLGKFDDWRKSKEQQEILWLSEIFRGIHQSCCFMPALIPCHKFWIGENRL